MVLVTGVARGLGRVDALKFAAEACCVAICDLDLKATQKVTDEIEGQGGRARAYCCDISEQEQVKQMVDDIQKAWKPVDILVNNAACLDNFSALEKMEDRL